MNKKIAVISTGNGGQALAAYLAGMGYRVALYAREQERVDMFSGNSFSLSGEVRAEAGVELISCDMGRVVLDAYLILVTAPAQYHHVVAGTMAKSLQDGQTIVLNPGRTFGTLEFDKVLREHGCTAKIRLGETDTFMFTCRSARLAMPVIYKIKNSVRLAGHDPRDTPYILSLMSELFPNMQAAPNVLYTGFTNIGMVFHPLPILMNITRVEAKEDFRFYVDGISPLVAGILEKLDKERVAVARALGAEVPSAARWLSERYGSEGDTLYEMIQNTDAYKNVLAPTDIDTRYIFEDIRTGCVPASSAGRIAGVPTRVLDAVIEWASILYETDFRAQGRNEKKLNIEDFIAQKSLQLL